MGVRGLVMVLAILLLTLAFFCVLATLVTIGAESASNELKVTIAVYNSFLITVMCLAAVALM